MAQTSRSSKRGASAGKAVSVGVSWRDAGPAPIVLVSGTEDYLASRAISQIRNAVRTSAPDVEEHNIDAANYAAGDLSLATSPSLFSSDKLIIADNAASMSDDFLTDALSYLDQPEESVVLVIRHGGGMRGKKLLDAIKKSTFPVIDAAPLKKDAEKLEFVRLEVAAQNRRMEQEAGFALVQAVGASLPDLAAAVQQLLSDVSDTVTKAHVDNYYGGRQEATAFKVADAAVTGQRAVAMSNLRHAIDTGVDIVPIVAALAIRMRQIASVFDFHGPSAALAKQLGMAPWQVDQAKRDARRFTAPGIKRSIQAIAQADFEVKGGAKDPIYAVEHAILTVSARD